MLLVEKLGNLRHGDVVDGTLFIKAIVDSDRVDEAKVDGVLNVKTAFQQHGDRLHPVRFGPGS